VKRQTAWKPFAAAGIDDRHHPGDPSKDPQLLEVGKRLLDKWQVRRGVLRHASASKA